MRKISQNIATSFYAGKPLHIDNTYTDGEKVYLHSNLIAKKIHPDKLEIFGWLSNNDNKGTLKLYIKCVWLRSLHTTEGRKAIPSTRASR